MNIKLSKSPKNVTIIEGFPGFGLVGTITTEYLIQHLDCELIGKFWLEELQPTVVIHEKKLVHPIGVFYNKKYNLVIIHAITAINGVEWKIADYLDALATKLKAKEIVCIEGVGSSAQTEQPQAFYHSTKPTKKLDKIGLKPLAEGIIIGITASLLLKTKTPLTALFADTHSDLPDSKAAAKVIEVLDQYLNIDVDTAPLLETAKKFEEKLKGLVESTNKASKVRDAKKLSYFG